MPANPRVTVVLGPQGRVVIPAPMRRALAVAPGDELALSVEEDRLVIEPRKAAVRRARGMFRHLSSDVSVVDELLAQRRDEAGREAAP